MQKRKTKKTVNRVGGGIKIINVYVILIEGDIGKILMGPKKIYAAILDKTF